jgi:hypothetical protein
VGLNRYMSCLASAATPLVACTALVVFASAANASSYTFDGTFNGGIAADMTINLSNTAEFGGYEISSVTGTIGGASITGLDSATNPNDPSPGLYTDTQNFGNLYITYDNVFYTSPQHLDGEGLSVILSNGYYANISANTGGYTGPTDTLYGYFLVEGFLGGPYCSVCVGQSGPFTVAEVAQTPLPSTWTMLVAGFIGLGLFAFSGAKKSAVAIASA